MPQDNLRKRLLINKNIQKKNKNSPMGAKPPLPESQKIFLSVPNLNDDYISDGYSSNASNYSDLTDSYPNSFYSDSETENHSIASSTSKENIDTNKKPTQTTNARKSSRLHRYHRKHRPQVPKSIFAFRRVYFILGMVIGALTIYLATKKMDEYKNMPSILKNVINDIGFDYLSSDFVSNMQKIVGENFVEDDNFLPGRDLVKTYNLTAKYPIFIIPGITSCGLETWMDPNNDSSKCSETYFRKRMWGTLNMPKAILLDRKCWLEHMMLDPETGLDPPGYKLRASPGLTSADYLFPGYWVWGKVITNLGTIGYDSNNIIFSSYDWRLSPKNLEVRDGFFTDLKMSIEKTVKLKKEKVVIIAHSMGFNVFFYFLSWVQSPEGGNAGKDWVNNHIKTFIDVAGTALGVPKACSALVSGETKDTAQLGTFLSYVLEKLLSMKERVTIFKNYGSISSMIPKGGDIIWGRKNEKAPDQDEENFEKNGPYGILTIQEKDRNSNDGNITSIYGSDVIPFLNEVSDSNYKNFLKNTYSHDIAFTEEEIEKNKNDETKWNNPLEVSLPEAPDMNIYCLYGINKPTERKYYYVHDPYSKNAGSQTVSPNSEDFDSSPKINEHLGYYLDQSKNDPNRKIENGIQFDNGDGTVPVVSSGYMCEGGWKMKRYNPSQMKVTTREYSHNPYLMWVRGGPETADHVDILGNHDLLKDILFIVSGNEHLVSQRVQSDLPQIVKEINRNMKEAEESYKNNIRKETKKRNIEESSAPNLKPQEPQEPQEQIQQEQIEQEQIEQEQIQQEQIEQEQIEQEQEQKKEEMKDEL
ncbi:LACT-domain-containing protein [Piromyces finnis]|uniref:LACT-domain-containing protein n=1 Tax=Piromyces finnis TaxID=1754191 RepID=A0A1Y1V9F4_9FUNG|nr:LACT-domain-containing protein [Piromyces finnis]|eukprot:ORX49999.1 LACT-domain-containing protein [Piromyces finnis]